MRKIPSVFKRDYDGDRTCYDEVVEGCEWVLDGEGRVTEKFDGTSCLWKDGLLWKRYDRKLTKAGRAQRATDVWSLDESHFKPAPGGWVACEDAPNLVTGHWPGWVPVGNGPEDQWHAEGFRSHPVGLREGQTLELVGPKIQANPYGLAFHQLWRHGEPNPLLPRDDTWLGRLQIYGMLGPRSFHQILDFLHEFHMEGLVFHHDDGRMAKVKSKDFGLVWP